MNDLQFVNRPKSFIDRSDKFSIGKTIAGVAGLLIIFIFVVTKSSLPFFAILIFLVGAFVYRTIQVIIAKPGELIFPHYPLRLGDRVSLKFKRSFRIGIKNGATADITIKFICKESATYTVGTGSNTEYATVFESLTKHKATFLKNEMEVVWKPEIPVNAPPSFNTHSNSINWELIVITHIPSFFKDDSRFQIYVLPEVVQ
jgi:hypothetical protein